jgi:hypothetical protein
VRADFLPQSDLVAIRGRGSQLGGGGVGRPVYYLRLSQGTWARARQGQGEWGERGGGGEAGAGGERGRMVTSRRELPFVRPTPAAGANCGTRCKIDNLSRIDRSLA